MKISILNRASAPHPPPFDAKSPDPVLQISLLFVENSLSALNGAWNLIVSFHFLSYCFVFFCLLRLLVPFVSCFIPAHFVNLKKYSKMLKVVGIIH